MTDRETMYQGLSHGAWGYFFLNVDFNLNNISILPRFVGFLLLLSAVDKLSGERRDLKLLRPLCILLAAWNGVDWLLSWGGIDVDGFIPFLDLVVTAAALYFHFQFLTDMAALAERYKPEGSDLDRSILENRTCYLLLVTTIGLLGSLAQAFPWEWWPGVVVFVALITCIVALIIMMNLFRLRRCFQEKGTDGLE